MVIKKKNQIKSCIYAISSNETRRIERFRAIQFKFQLVPYWNRPAPEISSAEREHVKEQKREEQEQEVEEHLLLEEAASWGSVTHADLFELDVAAGLFVHLVIGQRPGQSIQETGAFWSAVEVTGVVDAAYEPEFGTASISFKFIQILFVISCIIYTHRLGARCSHHFRLYLINDDSLELGYSICSPFLVHAQSVFTFHLFISLIFFLFYFFFQRLELFRFLLRRCFVQTGRSLNGFLWHLAAKLTEL